MLKQILGSVCKETAAQSEWNLGKTETVNVIFFSVNLVLRDPCQSPLSLRCQIWAQPCWEHGGVIKSVCLKKPRNWYYNMNQVFFMTEDERFHLINLFVDVRAATNDYLSFICGFFSRFYYVSCKKCWHVGQCFSRPKIVSLCVLICLQPRSIQLTVIEEGRNQKISILKMDYAFFCGRNINQKRKILTMIYLCLKNLFI